MGTGKKEATRKERQGKVGDGMGNVKVKGENFYRDAKKLRTLNMFKDGKAQHDAAGNVTKAASYQSRDAPVARIEPHRKWFGNTRVISQEALTSFREAVAERASDPYQVLLKTNKLPMSLIRDGQGVNGLKQHEAKMAIETSPYGDTFGPKAQRKRVKLGVSSLEDLAGETAKKHDAYIEKTDTGLHEDGTPIVSGDVSQEDNMIGEAAISREAVFLKGQSKRIWNELYKVIDSSDVVIHALDARDPEGTRCRSIEKYIREEAPHKHLIFVLNKCDLVPTGVAAAWVRHLSKDRPTLAFHASINNSFGKGSLIQLLRQFSSLHADRKQIAVGFIGYPNTGKSSIINTLRKKKVCTVAPIPGETKVWQYITLMKRIYLIDCPGVVPPNQNDSPEDILLRGVVRVENVENPEQYIPAILKRVQPKHLERTYGVKNAEEPIEFLSVLARKGGRLLRGGEPDLDGVAKMVINDFLRGKLPWYTPPPYNPTEGDEKIEGREGRLGEMGRKRKLDETTLEGAEKSDMASDKKPASATEEDFEGFGDSDDDNDSIANLEISDEESGEEND
ncbi:GTPase required for pre-60S ribosomal subunit nuclear export and maturation [Aspergillus melleus]|uniref:GTPase required for pre-60S ribosomal subunit nuclear export and maturation n=1 Tax=Aspergillus melleus TaxID=138277 RepID=A0ACC3AV85_9EURO|nr:GTPase required for pre-60S ribosomal subunit nuclear export and maturation [Aspergillus melleus]